MYWWEGKIVNDNEHVIIAKTNEKNFKKLENEARKLHSYQIPCILKINANANKDYDEWANKELN